VGRRLALGSLTPALSRAPERESLARFPSPRRERISVPYVTVVDMVNEPEPAPFRVGAYARISIEPDGTQTATARQLEDLPSLC
jgi:hypothetical protein